VVIQLHNIAGLNRTNLPLTIHDTAVNTDRAVRHLRLPYPLLRLIRLFKSLVSIVIAPFTASQDNSLKVLLIRIFILNNESIAVSNGILLIVLKAIGPRLELEPVRGR